MSRLGHRLRSLCCLVLTGFVGVAVVGCRGGSQRPVADETLPPAKLDMLNQGDQLINDGEDLVAQGEKLNADGKDGSGMIEEGQDMIAQGKQIKQKAMAMPE